jgi:hypothetical protein
MYATDLAEELDIPEVYIPAHASVFSLLAACAQI